MYDYLSEDFSIRETISSTENSHDEIIGLTHGDS